MTSGRFPSLEWWGWESAPLTDLNFNGYFQLGELVWVNYNDLTTTSLGIMVSKGNHPQMGLIQVSEIL
jgi:hypothetical protein